MSSTRTSWPKSDQGLISLAHLHVGEALDALGKRDEAMAEYQVVLKRENVFDSHKLAEVRSGTDLFGALACGRGAGRAWKTRRSDGGVSGGAEARECLRLAQAGRSQIRD